MTVSGSGTHLFFPVFGYDRKRVFQKIRRSWMEMNVIFYPSGYLQLQVADDGDDFCHVYDNPNSLAKDVSSLLDGDNTIGWYGNDPDAWLDVEKTPAIRYISMLELPAYLKAYSTGKIDRRALWENETAFYQALADKRGLRCTGAD